MEDGIVSNLPCKAGGNPLGKVATAANIRHSTRRNAAVVVADPHITVVESAEAADPAAPNDALELLVKWAVRSCTRGESGAVEAPTDKSGAGHGVED